MINKFAGFFRIFSFVAIFAILTFWIAVSASTRDRYQQHSQLYINSYIHQGDIDVVASGSSRTSRLANPVILKAGLEKKLNQENITVYNYGKGGRDIVVDYVYIRDYLKQHCVGTILFEMNQSSPTFRVNKFFDQVVPYRVIWDSYLNDDFFSLPKRIQLALRSSMNKLFQSVYRRYKDNYDEFDLPPQSVRTIKRGAHENDPVIKKRPPDKNFWNMNGAVEHRQTRYVHKILAEAEKYGTKVIFYYPPSSESQPLTDASIKEFEAIFDHPLHQLNQKQLDDMRSKRAFGDYNHVNDRGQKYMVSWIVENFDIQLVSQTKCSAE